MANWVIDENVFECAVPEHRQYRDAFYLIETISRFHKLVLDYDNVLMGRYRRHFDRVKWLGKWFADVTAKAGSVEYRCCGLSTTIEARLDSLGFDPDDKCFLGAALRADRLIVSEDGDFTEPPAGPYIRDDLTVVALKIAEAITEEAGRR